MTDLLPFDSNALITRLKGREIQDKIAVGNRVHAVPDTAAKPRSLANASLSIR